MNTATKTVTINSAPALITAVLTRTEQSAFPTKQAAKERMDRVALLLAGGADVNAQIADYKSTALHLAAQYGYVEIVGQLLNAGADVNLPDKDCCTALFSAVFSGNNGKSPKRAIKDREEIVSMLLAAAADVNVLDRFGTTPLICATTKNHVGIVALLLAAGADVNLVGAEAQPALMMAAGAKNPGDSKNPGDDSDETVTLLLRARADVNAQDSDGMTALMFAVNRGNVGSVTALVEFGADIETKSNDGRVAADYSSSSDSYVSQVQGPAIRDYLAVQLRVQQLRQSALDTEKSMREAIRDATGKNESAGAAYAAPSLDIL